MNEIYDNVPYNKIEQFVKEDLSIYGQNNPCPKSKTVVNGKLWRHYELGAIYGFVVYNEFIEDYFNKSRIEEHYRIASICEDDENWYAPSTPLLCDAFWVTAINNTYQRLYTWINEHLIQGWNKGANISDSKQYRRELKKPIENEIIEWKDEPDNAVLGTKYCYIEE